MYIHHDFDVIIKCGGSEINCTRIIKIKIFIREWAETTTMSTKKYLFACFLHVNWYDFLK